MPTTMRSSSREVLGQHAAEHELDDEQAEQRRAPRFTLMLRFGEHRDREHRLRGGEEQLLALQRVERQAVQRARRRSRTRSAASRRAASTGSPSTTAACRSPALVLSRHANSPAMSSSGASDASGATHCTSRNVSMPACSPRWTSDSANGSAHSEDHRRPRTRAACRRRCVAARSGASPISRAGPTRCGSSAGARAMPEHEHDEDADEDRPRRRA